MLEVIFWFLIYAALFLLLIYVLYRFASRKWPKTADTVIKRFLDTKEKNPDLPAKELFMKVLDERYLENPAVMKHLFHQKETYKEYLVEEVEVKKKLLKKYNLPVLIYTCLVIERNSILYNPKKSGGIEKLLADIEEYVRAKGLGQYI